MMRSCLLHASSLGAVLLATTALAQDGQPAVPDLPPPEDTSSVSNHPTVIGWPGGRTPTALEGFEVTKYADSLDYPRWIYELPNGDVLVSETRTRLEPGEDQSEQIASKSVGESADRITLLRDTDDDGAPDFRSVFLDGLNQPFGMALVGDQLFVGNTDGLMRFDYERGTTSLDSASGERILELPAGGYNNHWTRNVVPGPSEDKLYVTVGSASNVGEYGMAEEKNRANILEVDLDGSNMRVVASGLRNPNGLDFQPTSGEMWTAVNERDEIGDDLVPDYITSVEDGGFYGWPFSYYGQNEDPRLAGQRPDLVEEALVPDLAVGAHTASLGLTFYDGDAFPQRYWNGAFVGQHGSWNRTEFSGYKVLFVPFERGRPSGPPEDFLAGFIADEAEDEVYGRPCGVTVLADGSLLVADDAADTIWRVAPAS